VGRPQILTPPGELVALGRAAGLDAVGVCTAGPFPEVRAAIEQRKADGLHAGMGFTYRQPERSTDPQLALRRARSLIVGAYAYRRAEPPQPEGTAPLARVAAYAWDDHYAQLKDALSPISQRLRADGWRTRIVTDDNALVDRAAAVRAGIAWWGKSANVLVPGRGSWFVLGTVITDAPLVDADPPAVADGCATCRRCLDGCPTAAIVAPGVVDARRCLSWLLQAPGTFPHEFRVALGDRIYGCDDCQEVCPPNRREDRAGLGAAHDGDRRWVDVLALLAASDTEILARHGRWYIWDREPRWIRRNALLVLANTADGSHPDVEHALVQHLAHTDPMLRAHAVWAADRLGRRDLLRALAGERHPEVVAELQLIGAA
jgi:epoxyqueuosine reductase